MNFAKTIWWLQFECSDGWIPECITKLGGDVKTKSMQEAKLLKICVGSFIIYLRDCEINLRLFEVCYIVLVLPLHPRIKIT